MWARGGRALDGDRGRGERCGNRPGPGGGCRRGGRRAHRAAAGGAAEERGVMTTTKEPTRAPVAPAGIEANGINVIAESEGKGTPGGLFRPGGGSKSPGR